MTSYECTVCPYHVWIWCPSVVCQANDAETKEYSSRQTAEVRSHVELSMLTARYNG